MLGMPTRAKVQWSGRDAKVILSEQDWIDHIIAKYNLTRHHLPEPYYDAETVRSWGGLRKTPNRPERAARWPDEGDPQFAIQTPITSPAIGWSETGKLMFLYLHTEQYDDLQRHSFASHQDLRKHSLDVLEKLRFFSCDDSGRPELKRANERNGRDATVRAEELNMGQGADRRIYEFTQTKKQRSVYKELSPLLRWMGGVYQRTLPEHFRAQNTKINIDFRQGGSPFSSVAILKSAPSAVHLDARNGDSFACMTTVDDPDAPYRGGTFCFVQYRVSIAVKPGHILIATTPRDWHCNLDAVTGKKYSIVGYYKQALHSPGLFNKYQMTKQVSTIEG